MIIFYLKSELMRFIVHFLKTIIIKSLKILSIKATFYIDYRL